jgi:hypothetical protein
MEGMLLPACYFAASRRRRRVEKGACESSAAMPPDSKNAPLSDFWMSAAGRRSFPRKRESRNAYQQVFRTVLGARLGANER